MAEAVGRPRTVILDNQLRRDLVEDTSHRVAADQTEDLDVDDVGSDLVGFESEA